VKGVIDALASKPSAMIREEVARVFGRRPPEDVIRHARDIVIRRIELD